MPRLTIITPTYNRAELLKECWASLSKQTNTDFQWLVVDDGSTDSTKEVIEEIKRENPSFQIDYVYKENGGKHTALNASHPYIQGKYVTILDSDDYFTNDAVETILSNWDRYEKNLQVGEIVFQRGYSMDEPICYGPIENKPVDMVKVQRVGKYGRDCCDTFRTELFKKHPFKEFPNEKFLGEGSAFLFIEMECLGVYINKIIYVGGYREDGLTIAGRKMRIKNPQGGRYNSQVYMNKRLPLKTRLKKGILYTCYGKFCDIGLIQSLKENDYKLLTLVTYLPGIFLYHRWKKQYLEGE